jgi:integrase
MVYSFARIGAALGMTIEEMFTQNRRLWVRLREKGAKSHAHAVPPQPRAYFTAYIATDQHSHATRQRLRATQGKVSVSGDLMHHTRSPPRKLPSYGMLAIGR